MFKNWLSKGANMMQNAVDVVAPRLTTKKQEFDDHWRVVQLFAEELPKRRPEEVEKLAHDYYVSHHLKSMLVLLQVEDRDRNREPVSCYESFLHARVVDTLSSLAVAEKAPKLTRVILTALVDILKLQYSILPQAGACSSILRVVDTLHVRGPSGEYVSKLLELMYTLADKFRADPSLHSFFFINARDSGDVPQFLLFSTLLPYLERQGSDGQMARRALLCCLRTSDPDIASYVELHSGCIERVIRWLVRSFTRAMERVSSDDQERPTVDSAAFVVAFRFIDDICRTAHPQILVRLLGHLDEAFFWQALRPALIQASEFRTVAALLLVRRGLAQVSAPSLLGCYLRGLVGDDMSREEHRRPDVASGCDGTRFRATLIRHMDSLNDHLAAIIVHLFSALLRLTHADVTRCLLPLPNDPTPPPAPDYTALVNFYEGLFPTLNCGRVTGPKESRFFKDYLDDARRSVTITYLAAELWETPTTVVSTDTDGAQGLPLFVQLVLGRLDKCLENTFEINVALTGLIASLAALPCQRRFNMIFLPVDGERNLASVLQGVSGAIEARAGRVPDFADKLDTTRIVLKQPQRASPVPETSATLDDYEAKSLRALCRASVVLEELKVELIALFKAREEEIRRREQAAAAAADADP